MRFVHAEVVVVPVATAALVFAALAREPAGPCTSAQPAPAACDLAVTDPTSCPPAVEQVVRQDPPIVVVRERPFDDGTPLPAEMKYRGKLVSGARWNDRAGENVVIFSQRLLPQDKNPSSSYLYASHYVRDPSGAVKLVREIKEADEDCNDDLASFFHRAHLLTDLDGDGLGELTFGYFHDGCVTDVSPSMFKLLLVEGGDKHVLRGQGYFGEHVYRSEVPAASRDTPAVFARHLQGWWPWLSDQSKNDVLLPSYRM